MDFILNPLSRKLRLFLRILRWLSTGQISSESTENASHSSADTCCWLLTWFLRNLTGITKTVFGNLL